MRGTSALGLRSRAPSPRHRRRRYYSMQIQTLNIKGQIVKLDRALVMGIINATPDSFYAGSRVQEQTSLEERIEHMYRSGASIIDLGGYSSKPGASDVSPAEERARLRPALEILMRSYPELPVSIDTFRADIARWAVEEYGVALVNDISGGQLDSDMFRTVGELRVPYILMHMRGTPQSMQSYTDYDDLVVDLLDYFIGRIAELRSYGVHDIILDPGFGFSKTLEQNYTLLTALPRLKAALGLPILVGISRKSMIYRCLGTTPEESLNGTSVLNTYSLLHGADILRVHDVPEAVECVRLTQMLRTHALPADNPICHHWAIASNQSQA